jgi:glycosyltransferase involved in cell wall biosynthesis
MQSSTKVSKSFLIINHYAGAPKYGPAYRHYDISKELIKQGHKVCIIASSNSHLRNSPDCKKENIDGINFIWVKTQKYNSYGFKRFLNMFLFSFNLFFYQKHFPFRPDFVIVSSPSPFPIINGIYLKIRYKAKFLYEIRDVWPKSIIELKEISKNNIVMIFLNILDYLGLKYSDFILSPLNNIELYIKEKNIQNKESVFLPNGVSSIRPNKINLRTKNKNKFIVGYGGNLSDNNSIMNLIDSAIILKDNNKIIFKIIGFGELKNKIKDIINHQNLKNIELYGRLSKDELFDALSICDTVYKGNPTKDIYKYGISSIKLVEYMILKKPILDASDGDNLVINANAGISIKNESPEELAKSILKMSKMDKSALLEMGENGYNYVCENYLYSNTVSNMLRKIM